LVLLAKDSFAAFVKGQKDCGTLFFEALLVSLAAKPRQKRFFRLFFTSL